MVEVASQCVRRRQRRRDGSLARCPVPDGSHGRCVMSRMQRFPLRRSEIHHRCRIGCRWRGVALIGAQRMSFDRKSLALLSEILETLEGGFTDLPDYQPAPDLAALRPVLTAAAERMHDNYPYQHPLYAGQMLKPPHPVARLAYAMAQFVNPNNHAMDGGRASSMMEREAVAELGHVWLKQYFGHLCGGGTMANMEALGRGASSSRQEDVASDQAHHRRPDQRSPKGSLCTCTSDARAGWICPPS